MTTIWIGYDPREDDAAQVAVRSLRQRCPDPLDIRLLELADLQLRGLYNRPTTREAGQLWDVISQAPMSTEFAISRFLVPHLMGFEGWALFMDCDMLIRSDIRELFEMADPRFAVQCVQHSQRPMPVTKMDGQLQTAYMRKNWSSVMLMNCAHPANRALDLDLVNRAPGRDLHGFRWLQGSQIGALPARWNHLVGVDPYDPDAKIAHFTLGIPSMPGYEDSAFAQEWRDCLAG